MTRTAGLTLIELLAALLVLAVLATAGVPTLTDFLLDARMAAQVNRFVHGVHVAKRAAHSALTPTALCKSPDGLQCSSTAAWHDGWVVFVNTDRDYPPQIDPGERVLDVSGAFLPGTIVANRANFVFRPFETRSTNGALTFCDRRGAAKSRAVIVSAAGRPRTTAGTTPDCER